MHLDSTASRIVIWYERMYIGLYDRNTRPIMIDDLLLSPRTGKMYTIAYELDFGFTISDVWTGTREKLTYLICGDLEVLDTAKPSFII